MEARLRQLRATAEAGQYQIQSGLRPIRALCCHVIGQPNLCRSRGNIVGQKHVWLSLWSNCFDQPLPSEAVMEEKNTTEDDNNELSLPQLS